MSGRVNRSRDGPTILVTGAGGLIGGHLLTLLTQAGYPVVGTYRRTVPHGAWPEKNPPTLIQWDMADPVPDLPRAEVIVHASAHTHLTADSKARDYVHSNLLGTLDLLDYAQRQDLGLFVFLSTMSVYGDIDAAVVDAATPLSQPRMYGATKYLGELIVDELATNFPALSLRLPGVVARGYFTPWIGQVLKKALGDEPIEIYNPDAPFNNIIHVGEIARLIAYLTQHKLARNLVANIAASEPISVRSAVDLVVRLSGSKSSVIENSIDRKSFVIDTQPLYEETGFQPMTTAAAVAEYVKENLT